MKVDCVSFEQAKTLKELGFPLAYCTDVHTYEEPWSGLVEYVQETNYDKPILPSLYLVQKWLREEKEIYLDIISEINSKWENGVFFEYTIMIESEESLLGDYVYYDTYEKALSAGIDKCIELLKEK